MELPLVRNVHACEGFFASALLDVCMLHQDGSAVFSSSRNLIYSAGGTVSTVHFSSRRSQMRYGGCEACFLPI